MLPKVKKLWENTNYQSSDKASMIVLLMASMSVAMETKFQAFRKFIVPLF